MDIVLSLKFIRSASCFCVTPFSSRRVRISAPVFAQSIKITSVLYSSKTGSPFQSTLRRDAVTTGLYHKPLRTYIYLLFQYPGAGRLFKSRHSRHASVARTFLFHRSHRSNVTHFPPDLILPAILPAFLQVPQISTFITSNRIYRRTRIHSKAFSHTVFVSFSGHANTKQQGGEKHGKKRDETPRSGPYQTQK